MNNTKKICGWFLFLITAAGICSGMGRRADLGQSFTYSVEEYRTVDPSLIHYAEVEPLVPNIGKLSALAIAPDGKIYVGGENAVEMFPAQTIFPVDGTPSCLAVDDEGSVFVGMQNHVEIFSIRLRPDSAAEVGTAARQEDWKKTVWPLPGPKAYLTAIAVDDDFVFVADAGSRRVWRYSKTGGEPYEIGAKDEATGVRGFYIPSPYFDLDIGIDGSLWVVNPGYHALENYSPDGRLISSWARSSFRIDGFSGCCNPANFALMPDGSFVTAEKGLPRVKIHNLDGSLRCAVAAPDQFDDPVEDLATDEVGRIYVLSGDRIRVFEEKMQ